MQWFQRLALKESWGMNHVVYVSRDNIDIPLSFEGLALEFYQTSFI